eukprot:ANDGO_06075.mRNA.1 hypothetical protein JH06_3334
MAVVYSLFNWFRFLVAVVVLALFLLSSIKTLIPQTDLPLQNASFYEFSSILSEDRLPVTVFTVPKGYHGSKRDAQESALISWLDQGVSEVLLLDNEPEVFAVAEHYESFGVKHIPEVARSNFGTPVLPSVFSEAEKRSPSSNLMMYVNSDIILHGSLRVVLDAIARSPLNGKAVLAVARRIDVRPEMLGRIHPKWKQTVEGLIARGQFEEKNPCYVDFFLYNKTSLLFEGMPDLLLGRFRWDNWLTHRGRKNGYLLDVSEVLRAVHIHHHTKSYTASFRQPVELAAEIQKNHMLTPDLDITCVDDAQWIVTKCKNMLQTGRHEWCVERRSNG